MSLCMARNKRISKERLIKGDTMSSLFELTKERLTLKHDLEALDFDSQTITDTLDSESTELDAKIADYGFIIIDRVSFGTQMQAEIDRMQARLTAYTKCTDAIKAWLLKNMQACQISRIDCPAFSVSLRVNPPTVVIDAESLIPKEYMRTPVPNPPVPAPDKKAIADAIKQGIEVTGCHLEQTQRLVIE